MKVSSRLFQRALIVLGILFVAIQVVRPAKTNPPVDPAKTLRATSHASPEVIAVLDRACADCHSSESRWPWFSNIAPASWFIIRHVNEGRGELSMSLWGDYNVRRKARKLKEVCEQVEQHKMPMSSYLLLHGDAALSDADRRLICDWTSAETTALGPIPPEPPRGASVTPGGGR